MHADALLLPRNGSNSSLSPREEDTAAAILVVSLLLPSAAAAGLLHFPFVLAPPLRGMQSRAAGVIEAEPRPSAC